MKVLMRKLDAQLQQLSPLITTAAALGCEAALGLTDYLTPESVSFVFLYLLVVVAVGRYAGKWPAFLVSGVAVLTMTTVQGLHQGAPPVVWVALWNNSTRFLVFSIVGWLTAEVTRLTRHLSDLVEARTAQWKAEAERHQATSTRLAEALERFEQVVNNIAEVFWLTDVAKNQMAYISPSYERIWGRTCDELYREPRSWAAAIHPADRGEILRRAQTDQAAGSYDVEYRILRPDGAVRWVRDRAFPVRNEQGEVCRIAGIADDITERKQTRKKLQMQAAILENMAEGVVVTDEQGVIVQINPAGERIWGYERNEVVGQSASVFSALAEPEATAVRSEVLETLQTTGWWRGTFKNRRKDGAIIFCEAVINRVATPDGVLLVAVEQDVTERIRAEEQLKMQARVLKSLAEAVVVVDETGTIVLTNPAQDALLGYERGELVGKSMLLVAGYSAEEYRRLFGRLLEEVKAQGSTAGEYVARRKDGSVIEVETRSSGMSIGGRFHLIIVGQDITARKQAEQALQQSEETLRTFLNALPEPALLMDRDGTLLTTNRAFARTLAVPGAELIGKDVFSLFPPKIAEARRTRVDQVLRTREPVQFEDTRDGRQLMNFLSPVLDAAGNVTRVAVFALDITERKQAESVLKRSEQTYRALVETTGTGYLILDLAGRVLDANTEYVRLSGHRTLPEILGRSVVEWTAPGDREKNAAAVAECLRTGEVRNLEIDYAGPNGLLTPIEINGTVVETRTGKTILSLCRDITERKRAEQTLRETHDLLERRVQERTAELQAANDLLIKSEQKYRRLHESMTDAFAAVDMSGRITEFNPAYQALLGYTAEELRDLTYAQLTPKLWHDFEERIVAEQILPRGHSKVYEKEYRRKDGTIFPIEIRTFLIRDATGQPAGMWAIVRDITERKRVEQALREGRDQLERRVQERTAELQAANAALRESEERYRSLVNNLNVGVYRNTPGPQGRFLHANPALARMHGYDSVEEFQKLRVADLYQEPGERQMLLAQLLRQGAVINYELRLKKKDGTPIYASVSATVHRGPNGQEEWIDGVLEDITERKRSEALLQTQRDLGVRLSLTSDLTTALNELIEIATQVEAVDCGGVYLIDPTSGQLNLAAHRGLAENFVVAASHIAADTPQAELVRAGQPVYLHYNRLPIVPSPAEKEEGLRAIAVVPLCHEGTILGCLNLASHQFDDLPLQTRVMIESVAAQAAGAIVRIRAEEALRQSETRLRAIISSAPVMLSAVDRDGIIRFEDGQAIRTLGITPGANVGRSVMEVYGHAPAVVENARRALRGEKFECLVEAGPTTLDCWYSPMHDKEGKPAGYIGVATNITERHRLERQILEISDREQARIGQDIHDGLCQQLVSLGFDANSLQSALSDQRRPLARTARRIAEAVDQAITEARQLARGLFPVRLETDGLPPALEELAKAVSARFNIRCRYHSQGPVAVPDTAMATHLYRIAQEALTNAVKHGHAQKISIRLKAGVRQLELQVEDDGAGISPATQSKATGMGLHIMHYRARALGGTLHLSPGQRGGTVVSCVVSCCIPQPAAKQSDA